MANSFAGGDDVETLLRELLDGDWPLSEDYTYISSMAATERLIVAGADTDAFAPLIAAWIAKLRAHGPSHDHVLLAVRDGAWIRLRINEKDDTVLYRLEGIAADYPMTRLDCDRLLQLVVTPALLAERRLREDAAFPAAVVHLKRATPRLLQSVLVQTIQWTPRLRLVYSLVDYLELRLRSRGTPPRIDELLERTVIAGEISRDLILAGAHAGIELYFPDDKQQQIALSDTGIVLIPFYTNTHWSLVVYSADHGVALIYDSLGATSSHAILAYQWLHSLKARLRDTDGRLPTPPEWHRMQQRGCECGWYCVVAATDAPPPAYAHVNARVVDVQKRWGDLHAIAQDLDLMSKLMTT